MRLADRAAGAGPRRDLRLDGRQRQRLARGREPGAGGGRRTASTLLRDVPRGGPVTGRAAGGRRSAAATRRSMPPGRRSASAAGRGDDPVPARSARRCRRTSTRSSEAMPRACGLRPSWRPLVGPGGRTARWTSRASASGSAPSTPAGGAGRCPSEAASSRCATTRCSRPSASTRPCPRMGPGGRGGRAGRRRAGWSATKVEGVFAGGDAVTGPSTVVAAIAHGRAAAERDRPVPRRERRHRRVAWRRSTAVATGRRWRWRWRTAAARGCRSADPAPGSRSFSGVELGYSREDAVRRRAAASAATCREV